VPFSTYETFQNASVRYQTTFSYTQTAYNFGSYQAVQTGEAFFFGTFSSGSGSYAATYENGDQNESVQIERQGRSSYSSALNEEVDTGPYTTSGATTQTLSEANTDIYKTSFAANQGVPITRGSITTMYYFSDSSDALEYIGKVTTTNNVIGTGDDLFSIQSTAQTTLSDTILSIDTTWTDVTTTGKTTRRTYTELSVTTTYPLGFIDGDFNPQLEFSGEALIIQPCYGTNWTQNGNNLLYLQIFKSTGSYGPFYSSIVKDNTQSASTIPAERQLISENYAVALGFTTIYTVISSSAKTITYDYIDYESSKLTFSTSYGFDGVANFTTDSNFLTSYEFYKKVKKSTTLSSIIQDEFLIDGQMSTIGFNYGLYTDLRPIQAETTDQFYVVDQQGSYFSSFTYRGLIKTTTQQTYIVHDNGIFGSSSTETSSSTRFDETNTSFNQTVHQSNREAAGNGVTLSPSLVYAYKSFYSLEIGSPSPDWTKYYSQYSPNFNFVVGGTSNSIGGYKHLLTPTSLITKLYFTTYKFERGGAINAPILAIPINYTSESNSAYTYQQVSVPSEFCLGSASASVYWTKSVADGTTNTTSSFTLAYAGSDTILSLGEFTQNDFSGGVGEVPYDFFSHGIYHTNGIVNTGSAATWSKDGYYYWRSTARATSQSTNNAISVVGNGQPITFIASQLTRAKAYPVVYIDKYYRNSYAY
jgi:hypothetical protein